MTAAKIWAAIEDWLIPSLRLNTHERALYYHLVRRTRLDGRRSVRISRSILARVSGLSPCIARHYLRSLARKQCIRILDRRPQGCLVEVRLPSQIRRALARLPQAAAAHLLWPPNQLERTAAGHPRAWPRRHPLVAPNFRAALLHRDALLDVAQPLLAVRKNRRTRVPHPRGLVRDAARKRGPGVRRLAAAFSAGHSASRRKQQPQPRASRHTPNPRVPHPRDSRGWASASTQTPDAARKRGGHPSSKLRDRRRRLASDLARKDKISTSPKLSTLRLSTFRHCNLHPPTRPPTVQRFDPSTFQRSTFQPFNISIKPRCFYCHTPLRPRQWSLDHIVPRTLGGSDSTSNLVAACHSCNSQKASSPADLFLRSLHRRRIISRSHLRRRLKSLRSLPATRH